MSNRAAVSDDVGCRLGKRRFDSVLEHAAEAEREARIAFGWACRVFRVIRVARVARVTSRVRRVTRAGRDIKVTRR